MSHKTLAELQTALQDFLLDKKSDVIALTLETPLFSRKARLKIYSEAYHLRLIDVLRNDYPALMAYIGDNKFEILANEYIVKNPSHHPSLRWFGGKLPQFLYAHPHWQKHIDIVELATFEWSQIMAFDAADEAIVTRDNLRTLQPDEWMTMQLKFHSSLQLLKMYTNAPTQWNALINENSAIAVEIMKDTQIWLIWRDALQVVYRPLDQIEAWALQAFLNSHTFSDICGGLCEWLAEAQVPMQAARYLQQWVRVGLITEIIIA